jgi:prevent-host-death family protein
MSKVNMLEAKTHLSRLVDAVESGAEKEIIIARNGKPAAKLVPVEEKRKKVRLGLARGKYPSMSLEEFNGLDEQIAKLFNEGSLFPEER